MQSNMARTAEKVASIFYFVFKFIGRKFFKSKIVGSVDSRDV